MMTDNLSGEFFISIKIQLSSRNDWWLTGVYGSNQPRVKKEVWKELTGLFGLCSLN